MANIKITELDFDILKENLKDFLKGQDEFQDYDFEGSGLQILLDILSANTHYNAIYQNMVANEMFLDSAVLRESVVSRSKVLGYVPNSVKSARVEITLEVVGPESLINSGIVEPESVTLPEYSNFSAIKDGVTYIFQNTEAVALSHTSDLADGRHVYSGTFTINQGIMVQEEYNIDYQEDPNQRYILSNQNADTETLFVRVTDTGEAPFSVSTLAENVVKISPDDNVYWLNENETGNYELFFGNDRIGKKLSDKSKVIVQYLTTSGAVGNNIKSGFNFSDNITVQIGSDNLIFSLHDISNNNESFGGADKEEIEDVRFNSPRHYQMQNRTVTALDYKFLIQDKYQDVDSVKVWGGEDNDPPAYGKVFISLKPKTGFFLTDTAKKNITDDIVKKYNVVSIGSEIVDPVFTYVDITSNVKYNIREIVGGENTLRLSIRDKVKIFNSQNLGKFDSYFRFSNLSTFIDNTSEAVKSNDTDIKIRDNLNINLSTPSGYEIRFNNEIVQGSLQSSLFTYLEYQNSFLEDDSNGKVFIKTYFNGVKIDVLNTNIGTIDYLLGKITLTNFSPTLIADGEDYIKIIATPRNYDLSPLRNQIITIDEETININMENISEQFLTQNRFE